MEIKTKIFIKEKKQMRKFSRLLAALLTVCMLCGMVLPFAALATDGNGAKAATVEEYDHTVASVEAFNALTLKSGDSVKVTASIEGAMPKADGLTHFKVVCANGATFALSADANFTAYQSGNTYYCVTTGSNPTLGNTFNLTSDAWNVWNDFEGNASSFFAGKGSVDDNTYKAGFSHSARDGHYSTYKDLNDTTVYEYKSTTIQPHSFLYMSTPWAYNTATRLTGDLRTTDYVVMDYDLGADGYWYTMDGTTYQTGPSVPDGALDSGLGLLPGTALGVTVRKLKYGPDDTELENTIYNGSRIKPMLAYIWADEDGTLYACNSATSFAASTVKIPLVNEVGKTDHISIIIENNVGTDATGEYSLFSYYIYVNGQYLNKLEYTKDSDKIRDTNTAGGNRSLHLEGFRVGTPGANYIIKDSEGNYT
ncbi:MAG: hypothetical protein IKC91_01325, partial [Clostridia bacterium]|nr:hypothetical protein [Clostridia bacterium]